MSTSQKNVLNVKRLEMEMSWERRINSIELLEGDDKSNLSFYIKNKTMCGISMPTET